MTVLDSVIHTRKYTAVLTGTPLVNYVLTRQTTVHWALLRSRVKADYAEE